MPKTPSKQGFAFDKTAYEKVFGIDTDQNQNRVTVSDIR